MSPLAKALERKLTFCMIVKLLMISAAVLIIREWGLLLLECSAVMQPPKPGQQVCFRYSANQADPSARSSYQLIQLDCVVLVYARVLGHTTQSLR